MRSSRLFVIVVLVALLNQLSPAHGQGSGQVISVENAATVTQIALLEGHTGPVFSLAFSPDGSELASGSVDTTVRLWDGKSGKAITELKGHTAQISAVSFTADSATVMSAGYDHTIRLWDAKTGTPGPVQTATADNSDSLKISNLDVAFSPDGTLVAYSTDDGAPLYLWNVKTQSQQTFDLEDPKLLIGKLVFSADGKWLAWPLMNPDDYAGHSVELWDVQAGKQSAILNGPDDALYADQGAAISPDDALLAVVNTADSTIQMWDLKTGKALQVLEGHKSGDNAGVYSLAFSPDSTLLASASYDNTIRLWDVKTAKPLVSLPSHGKGAAVVTFNPDGTLIASGDLDGTVQLWGIPNK